MIHIDDCTIIFEDMFKLNNLTFFSCGAVKLLPAVSQEQSCNSKLN